MMKEGVKKNKELKHKAYQVLIDKLEVFAFEEYLYKLVEEASGLKSDSILFNFLSIDYKSENFRKEFKNLIEDSFLEEELLSLEVYEKCLRIKNTNNREDIYNVLDEFSSLCLKYNYDYELIYEFYLLNIERESIYNGYGLAEEKDLLSQIKEYTSKVLERFEFYKEKEGWSKFLEGLIHIEPQNKVIKVKEEEKQVEKLKPKKWFEFWKN